MKCQLLDWNPIPYSDPINTHYWEYPIEGKGGFVMFCVKGNLFRLTSTHAIHVFEAVETYEVIQEWIITYLIIIKILIR